MSPPAEWEMAFAQCHLRGDLNQGNDVTFCQ